MDFTKEELMCQEEAKAHILSKKDELIKQFILDKNPIKLGFITIFMAGSPGSGKTEFSQKYLPLQYAKFEKELKKFLVKKGFNFDKAGTLFVRIDVDEIRSFLPQYQKTDGDKGTLGNAHVIQSAANKGLDILRDYCLKNEISFLHDGTFGNFKTMKKLIKLSLKEGRKVQIYYIYLDPVSAWEFTKAREYREGRNILKDKFIEQFFTSQLNVDKIKEEFGSDVIINCVLKKSDNTVHRVKVNVTSVDEYLKTQYKKGTIKQYSQEELFQLLD